MPQARNLLTLIGAISDTPELHTLNDGRERVFVTLAGSHDLPIAPNAFRNVRWRHRISIVGYRARPIADLPIGSLLYSEGTLRTRLTDDPNPQTRKRTEIYTHTTELVEYPNTLEYDQHHRPYLRHALNHTTISGNLTRDATHGTHASGTPYTFIIVATNIQHAPDDPTTTAHFLPILMQGDLALEHAELSKGDAVYVQGLYLNDDRTLASGERVHRTIIHATNAYTFERLISSDDRDRGDATPENDTSEDDEDEVW